MRIKELKKIICCLFHVKGYEWYAPWVRDELNKGGEEE